MNTVLWLNRRKRFSTSSRRRDLKRFATDVRNRWRMASIASDDALILPHRANPHGWNFRERQVNVAEGQSLRGFAPQHVELVSKDKDLGFQRSPRPEQSDEGAPDQPAKIAHRERVSPDSRSRSAVLGLR